jgi:hypothetical protein
MIDRRIRIQFPNANKFVFDKTMQTREVLTLAEQWFMEIFLEMLNTTTRDDIATMVGNFVGLTVPYFETPVYFSSILQDELNLLLQK